MDTTMIGERTIIGYEEWNLRCQAVQEQARLIAEVIRARLESLPQALRDQAQILLSSRNADAFVLAAAANNLCMGEQFGRMTRQALLANHVVNRLNTLCMIGQRIPELSFTMHGTLRGFKQAFYSSLPSQPRANQN